MTKITQSLQAEAHDTAKRQYGSLANSRAKRRLEDINRSLVHEYDDLKQTYGNEEDIIANMSGGLPYSINPVELATLPLHVIGAPDGSELHDFMSDNADWRVQRSPETKGGKRLAMHLYDYTSHGWPKSQGNARRMVTPEEHRAILSRLESGALTLPGSDVPLKSQSLSSLVEEELPQPAWIIEGILREGGAMMVYGPSGIGKTWFTHMLMLMASHGRSIGIQEDATGKWVLRAGPHEGAKVGLIDGEMRKEDIKDRMVTLCGVLGLKPGCADNRVAPIDVDQLRLAMEAGDTPIDDVELWTTHVELQNPVVASEVSQGTEGEGAEDVPAPRQIPQVDALDLSNIHLSLKTDQDPKVIFPDLVDPEWKQQIVEYTKTMGIKVLVLDNLSTLSPSLEDENASAQIAPLNDLVVALKQAGVATPPLRQG